MGLKTLATTSITSWPQGARNIILDILRNDQAAEADLLLAANMAGHIWTINDELAEALLSILKNDDESDELRTAAARSLGPVLEQCDETRFESPGEVAISESMFDRINDSLRRLYVPTGVPKNVRRQILEASVQAPQEWHQKAVHAAYSSNDADWKLTAIFAMRWVSGFREQILKELQSNDDKIRYHRVPARSVPPEIGS